MQGECGAESRLLQQTGLQPQLVLLELGGRVFLQMQHAGSLFKAMFVLLQLKTIERLREFPVTPKQRENSTTASSGP